MSGRFSRWYKGRFEEISGDPGPASWDKIAAALDKDAAVARSASRRKYRYSLSAVLLLLGTAVTIFTLIPEQKTAVPAKQNSVVNAGTVRNNVAVTEPVLPDNTKVIAGNKAMSVRNATDVSAPQNEIRVFADNSNDLAPARAEATAANSVGTIPETSNEHVSAGNNAENKTAQNDVMNASSSVSPAQPEIIAASADVPQNETEQQAGTAQQTNAEQNTSDDMQTYVQNGTGATELHSRFYAGLFYRYNNTWLLNHETFAGLGAAGLNQTEISFGTSFGILGGYQIDHHWALESNLALHSLTSQSYAIYEEGQLYHKEIRIHSTGLNLLAKRTFGDAGAKGSFSMVGGVNTHFISSYSISQSNGKASDDRYAHFSPGVTVGFDYTYRAGNGILLGAGLRTEVGLRNIYAGNHNTPGYFNTTSLSAIGVKFMIAKTFGK